MMVNHNVAQFGPMGGPGMGGPGMGGMGFGPGMGMHRPPRHHGCCLGGCLTPFLVIGLIVLAIALLA